MRASYAARSVAEELLGTAAAQGAPPAALPSHAPASPAVAREKAPEEPSIEEPLREPLLPEEEKVDDDAAAAPGP